MTVKLLLLKSGEDVVADVQEMCVGDPEKPTVIGYYLTYPCRAKLVSETQPSNGESKHPFRLQLTPWMPLTKDKKIPVVADWVVSVVEPIDELKKAWEQGAKKNEDRELETSGADGSEINSDTD